MFNKIKDYFGIEGLKVGLEIEDSPILSSGELNGHIIFETIRNQNVTSIQIELVERYQRGNKDQKLINEIPLGKVAFDTNFEVESGELFELPFRLPFTLVQSEMEKTANGIFAKAKIKVLKKIYRVKSLYFIKAKIAVSGTGFQPVAQQAVDFK